MEGTSFLIITVGLLLGVLLVFGGVLSFVRSRRKKDESDADLSLVSSARPIERSTGSAPGWLERLKGNSASPSSAGTETEASAAHATAPAGESSSSLGLDLRRKLPPDTIVLTREPGTGDWLIEVDGQRYRRLSDIHDDKAASKILGALEGMKSFAGLSAQAPAAPLRPGPSSATPAPLPPAVRRSGQATYPAPQGSIIAQIETILQRELALHADVAHRHVHMGVAPDGSLLIEVDTSFYRTPDEIPDRRIHDLVKLAVHTWEKSN